MPPSIESGFQKEILTIRFAEPRIVDSETIRRTPKETLPSSAPWQRKGNPG